MKGIKPFFLLGSLSEVVSIQNLWNFANRIWTCTKPELRLCWIKLCSFDNHHTMAPQFVIKYLYIWYKTSKNSSHIFGRNVVQVTNLGSNGMLLESFMMFDWMVLNQLGKFYYYQCVDIECVWRICGIFIICNWFYIPLKLCNCSLKTMKHLEN